MRSPYDFIVKPKGGKRYNNTKNIGGIDLVLSTSEEDHKAVNREGIVLATPLWYNGPIKAGDILLCHHNTFKVYNDMKGRRRNGRGFFRSGIFLVENDQFFMYKKNGQWFAHDRYCFVKPVKAESSFMDKGKYEPLVGEMVYPNDSLTSKGVNSGVKVVFKPDSEYEFNVDGELMYRMFDHQIVAIL